MIRSENVIRKPLILTTDVKAGYVRKAEQVELNETRDKRQWYLPHHPVINPLNLGRLEDCAMQQQSVNV